MNVGSSFNKKNDIKVVQSQFMDNRNSNVNYYSKNLDNYNKSNKNLNYSVLNSNNNNSHSHNNHVNVNILNKKHKTIKNEYK